MENLEFFDLKTEGDNAVVRLLHKGVETIESTNLHWVTDKSGKKKCVKCVSNGCPLCEKGEPITSRVYIHLFDYTDNKEKIWSRTDKILPQFKQIHDDWGDLSECVVRIKRDKQEFPTYTVSTLNANMYAPVNKDLVDEKVAYRCYMTRSVDELKQFVATGVMPAHESKPYVPKEEYMAKKNATNAPTPMANANTYANAPKTNEVPKNTPMDDPFIDPFSAPMRRV